MLKIRVNSPYMLESDCIKKRGIYCVFLLWCFFIVSLLSGFLGVKVFCFVFFFLCVEFCLCIVKNQSLDECAPWWYTHTSPLVHAEVAAQSFLIFNRFIDQVSAL